MDSRKITDPLNRGMVGGLLGVPADLAAMFLNGGRSIGNLANRLAGVNAPPAPMVENPVYGQEWWGNKMQQGGLVSGQRNKLAEFGAGLLDPSSAAKAPALAKGLFALGDPATTKMLGGLLGATVWHGSPHKFDAFDSSKIGTGEGAQAYGHGLYLAENKAVADGYRKGGHVNPSVTIDGQAPTNWAGSNRAEYMAMPKDAKLALRALADHKDIAMARQSALMDGQAGVVAALDDFVKSGRVKAGADGSLYKVDLPDEDIARMLDWDKPLSQQSHVMELINKQEAARTQSVLDQRMQTLANVGENAPNASVLKRQIDLLREEVAKPQESGLGAMTGGEYYNYLRRRDVAPTVQADMFKQAGIPGIRYLDGDSRGTGQGSSNFVVFPGNENRLKILERNGQPLK